MSELSIDVLVTNVLNGMMDTLDDEQLKKLKDQLYIQLRDVDITNKCYDLVELMQENDAMILKMFIASEKVRRLSEGTIKQYRFAVMQMRNCIGKNFADIQSVDIQFYLAKYSTERNWKTSYLNTNIHYISQLFKYMKNHKLITDNPMDMIEPAKEEKIIKEKFNTAEIEMIKIACRDSVRDIAMIEFLLATAVRVGELTKLVWHDLDFQHLECYVRQGKGKKDRVVPFSEKAGFYLLRYLDWRMTNENRTKEQMMERPVFASLKRDSNTKDFEKLTNAGVEKLLLKIGTKANIVGKKNPHKYRGTMATEAINHGMDVEVLMKILGHEQYDTTLGYAEVRTPKVEQQYRMVCD